MIREKLIDKGVGDRPKFRWRSHEISRIEALSDAVFAFAVTLLVVALEVPKTYGELTEVLRGFGAFAICFALLFVVWFNQYKFFRRYGLNDNLTIVMNAVLLFVVLFYVYPLKFLFTFLVDKFTGGHGEVRLPNGTVEGMVESADQVANLMIIWPRLPRRAWSVRTALLARVPQARATRTDGVGSVRHTHGHSRKPAERRDCVRITLDCDYLARAICRSGGNDLYAHARGDDCSRNDEWQAKKKIGSRFD
jgi:hypothetical protein